MSSTAPLTDISRLSFNQITADRLSLAEVIEACGERGVGWIGPWRHRLEPDSAERIRAAGLTVSSLCRGGFFPASDEAGRRAADDDNRRAVEQAAALGTDVLVLVCGGARGSELAAARSMVAAGIERLVPYAREHGIKLGIEPLHPMMTPERSVIVTLAQANEIAASFDPDEVGVVVDAYHVWWDPELERELERARGRIYGYHVSDWLVPTTDVLAGRGMMGDGVIDLRGLRGAVERCGYAGPIEVEVISSTIVERPGAEIFADVCETFVGHV